MKTQHAEIGEFRRLVAHTVLVAVLLATWLVTASLLEKVLLIYFTLAGSSLIAFRLLEFFLHLSTFRLVLFSFFRRQRIRPQWWL